MDEELVGHYKNCREVDSEDAHFGALNFEVMLSFYPVAVHGDSVDIDAALMKFFEVFKDKTTAFNLN